MTYTPIPINRPDPVIKVQPWGEEWTLAETPAYTLKKLVYRAGFAGGLQMHTTKIESFTLASGFGWLTWNNAHGDLIKSGMVDGDTVHVPAGAAHKFEAITDCVVYEASTNVSDDRVRLERYFGLGETEGLPSTHPEPQR